MKKLGKAYRKNIRSIAAVLAGGRPRLVATLRREMAMAAKLERYEEAARLRDQLLGLEDVFLHRPVLRATDASSAWTNIERLIRGRLGIMRPIKRIEGYDISNIAGSEPTGAMVVFVDGVPDRSQYRRFRIKTVPGISDVAMHQEMLRRRFIHSEWAYPDIIVIDGGKPQLHAAVQALRTSRVISRASPPTIVALAKREEELYIEGRAQPLRLREENPALLHLFQRVRDESHRFARKYHHFLRRKSLTHTRTE